MAINEISGSGSLLFSPLGSLQGVSLRRVPIQPQVADNTPTAEVINQPQITTPQDLRQIAGKAAVQISIPFQERESALLLRQIDRGVVGSVTHRLHNPPGRVARFG